MREVSPHLFIPRRPLIASMLASDPERSWISDCESIFDQFDEACVDLSLGTIRDDEALPFAGASQLRFDRQGDGVDIRPLAPSSRFQRRGDFRAVQPDVDLSTR